jgi:hypothetical protein
MLFLNKTNYFLIALYALINGFLLYLSISKDTTFIDWVKEIVLVTFTAELLFFASNIYLLFLINFNKIKNTYFPLNTIFLALRILGINLIIALLSDDYYLRMACGTRVLTWFNLINLYLVLNEYSYIFQKNIALKNIEAKMQETLDNKEI